MKPPHPLRRLAAGLLALTALLLCGATLAGCSGTPTTPSGGGGAAGAPPPPPIPGLSPTLTVSSLELRSASAPWVDFVGQPVTLSWDRISAATSYRVQVGTTLGASDVFSVLTPNLSVTTTFTSAGQLYPQVIAYAGRAGAFASTSRTALILLSFQDFVEALLLGTGPLAEAPQTGCPASAGRMSGWPSGARVTTTLAASLNADQKSRVAAAVGQASQAMAGAVSATTRDSSELHPLPLPSEITAQQADATVAFPCSAAAQGCTVPQFVSPGVLSRASIVMRGNSNLLGHEAGHALYGLCHVSASAGFVSVMGGFDDAGRGLSEADIAALRAVYQAGLRGGSTRSDFVAAGLVKP